MPQGYDRDKIRTLARTGEHRAAVGGVWDELGTLAIDYLTAQGLQPDMQVLDLGCGALRVGVRLVDFLEPDRYFGVDMSEEILDAGYDVELAAVGLQHKLPRAHLVPTDDFEFASLPKSEPFDMALAQSLFTHTPVNDLRLCLINLADVTRPGATLHATFFMVPDDRWPTPFDHEPGGITSYPTSNPYHFTVSDLGHAASGLPWKVGEAKDWGHPRAQAMVVFTRL